MFGAMFEGYQISSLYLQKYVCVCVSRGWPKFIKTCFDVVVIIFVYNFRDLDFDALEIYIQVAFAFHFNQVLYQFLSGCEMVKLKA